MELEEVKLLISPSRELIPINNGLTNFQTEFNIISVGGKPFRALVVNQKLLDKQDDIEMKNVPKGVFSGKIVKNSGEKEDWYIALESDEETAALVSVRNVEVEEKKNDAAVESYNPDDEEIAADTKRVKKKKRKNIWLIILIICIVAAIVYFCFKFFIKKPAPKKERDITPLIRSPTPPPLPEPAPAPEPVPAPAPEPEINMDFSELPPL